MKTILLILALLFAGCESDVTGVSEIDSKPSNNYFSIVQEYGYCDTVCIGESLVLADYILPYAQECIVSTVNTQDTLRSGLYKTSFLLYYNTQNPVSIDFGNGIYKSYANAGVDTIKYFCNKTYEVIICYE